MPQIKPYLPFGMFSGNILWMERENTPIASIIRRAAHYAIRFYQLTLSGLVGRHCRHWPSCSTYTDEAVQKYGLWRGGWMGVARICRCGPGGTHGIDLVPDRLPDDARWFLPWRYGRWRGVNAPPPMICESVGTEDERRSKGHHER